MIVNWKREGAGVLTIPCKVGASVDSYVTLVPGYNEVDDTVWKNAKEAATRLLKCGDLEELVEKRTVKVDGKDTVRTKFKGELDFENNFPYNQILSVMKDLGIYKEISIIKEDETDQKNFTKAWLVEFFEQDEDGKAYWDKIQSQFKDSDNESDKALVSISLDEMEPKDAEKVIVDTYNLKTLSLWEKKIVQPDLRVAIKNQIEKVNEPPKRR